MSYLMRRDPLRNMVRLQEEMDWLFHSLFGQGTAEAAREGARVPAVDISDTPEEVIVRAELPGISKEQLEIEALPEALTLKAEANGETETTGETYHRRERSRLSYLRTVPLPAEVKTAGVKATLQDGILEVRLPKSERAKPPVPTKVAIE